LGDSRFYEIEFYICKKADNRIFNCTTNTPVFTSQLQSPTTNSVFDMHCHTVVSVTPLTIGTILAVFPVRPVTFFPDSCILRAPTI